ncbi:MAG: FemAB family XrtA/PEP-CTERM system-associated protein, partial [Burkholderiaceae bacterium]
MNMADLARRPVALSVRAYRASDRAAWTRFVAACPEATFFHRIEWRELIEDVFRHRSHYLLAEQAGRIVAVLPLAEVRSLLFGHSLVSLPFAERAGVAALEPAAVGPLHAAARALAHSLGVEHLELRNALQREPDWPQQDLYVSFRKPIAADSETNLLAIPRKQRAMVRKAMQRGLSSEIESDARRFFALYADNAQRHGTPALPLRYFDALMRMFGDACEILTVLDNAGRPVSSVMSFYFRNGVFPYYAGDVIAARDLAA